MLLSFLRFFGLIKDYGYPYVSEEEHKLAVEIAEEKVKTPNPHLLLADDNYYKKILGSIYADNKPDGLYFLGLKVVEQEREGFRILKKWD